MIPLFFPSQGHTMIYPLKDYETSPSSAGLLLKPEDEVGDQYRDQLISIKKPTMMDLS